MVPRVALRLGEAAESLGVGLDFFRREIKPEVRIIRRGRAELVPVDELRSWAERNATATLPDDQAR